MNLLNKNKSWLKFVVLLMMSVCGLQTLHCQVNHTTPPGPIPALSRIEFYIDTDPGYGVATNVPFAPGTSVADQVINLDPATLTSGVHRLGIRSSDANGAWSLDNYWLFYKPYNGGSNITPAGPVPALSSIEYYIDTDPGYGLAINVPFAPGTSVADQVINLDPATLTSGVHRLGIRSKDANGAWSLDNYWLFYKPFNGGSNITPAGPVPALSRIEYYIDTDPGYGLATNVLFTPGTSVADQVINIDPATLTSGVHRLGIRSKDANGAWSLDNYWLFYKATGGGNNITPPGPIPNLARVEYYFDTDPGYGKGIAVPISTATDIPDFTAPINLSGLTAGAHKLGFRSMDANGAWSLDNKWDFTIPTPLPVTYVTFTPTLEKDRVVLQWSTATEMNSKDFSVQRSLDGISFETIGVLQAAGTSSSLRNYRFDDLQSIQLKGRVVYYRVIETDINGQQFFTNIKSVKIAGDKDMFTLFNNPVKNEALLIYESAQKGVISLRVIDHLGRVVMVKQVDAIMGTNNIKLQTRNMAKGLYQVELTSNNVHGIVTMMKD